MACGLPQSGQALYDFFRISVPQSGQCISYHQMSFILYSVFLLFEHNVVDFIQQFVKHTLGGEIPFPPIYILPATAPFVNLIFCLDNHDLDW